MKITFGHHTRSVRAWVIDLLPLLLMNEDPDNPLSDSQLVEYCAANGIPASVRTIESVRRTLGIPGAERRDKSLISDVKKLIEGEDKRHPLSDPDIAQAIAKERGEAFISTQVIFKARTSLGLPSFRERRTTNGKTE